MDRTDMRVADDDSIGVGASDTDGKHFDRGALDHISLAVEDFDIA
jgi:hypothetical protein